MATMITVHSRQIGPTTTEADIRSHRVLVDRPEAKGGADRGPMGGELLLAALGGCFSSTLFAAIASRDADVRDVETTIVGTLEEHPSRFSTIAMTVTAAASDVAAFERLVTIAERGCIVANTLRGAAELTIEVVARTPAA
ncbi:MAG: OsmC family protein [Trueperaceae bacterium]|nr:OsmC family protein [Trueperaceae bacterium]